MKKHQQEGITRKQTSGVVLKHHEIGDGQQWWWILSTPVSFGKRKGESQSGGIRLTTTTITSSSLRSRFSRESLRVFRLQLRESVRYNLGVGEVAWVVDYYYYQYHRRTCGLKGKRVQGQGGFILCRYSRRLSSETAALSHGVLAAGCRPKNLFFHTHTFFFFLLFFTLI